MEKKKIEDKNLTVSVFPLVILKDYVPTPNIPQPIKIDDDLQKEYLEKCIEHNKEVFFAVKDMINKSAEDDDILTYGIVGVVDRVMQMPMAPTIAFFRPQYRAKIEKISGDEHGLKAKVKPLKNLTTPKKISVDINYTLERIDNLFNEIMSFIGDQEKIAANKVVEENSQDIINHLYAISQVAPLTFQEKYDILWATSFPELVYTIALQLDETLQKIQLQSKIQEKTHRELSQQQKETFLRTHLKHIQDELGEGEFSDVDKLIEKARNKNWPDEAQEYFNNEIEKLRRLNINNPEYSVQHAYIENFIKLPWNNYKPAEVDLDKAEEILNRDHFGLKDVKDRILEHLAVLKLRNDLKAPIICLYGPPGVGKTSIGKSIAEAMGREYARISLGGLHDEAEIRGHRRTYIGSMPGRFIHTLSKCEYGNPLILLDEIDKVSSDFKGDPASALLEALDPEQNNTFHDNYIDYPYDLSKVLFIATANDLSSIPAPLKDRMEIIEIPGYVPEEKREIAIRHLVAKQLENNGMSEPKGDSEKKSNSKKKISEKSLSFEPSAIDYIISHHTREAGVRTLEKKIGAVIRKIARLKASGKDYPSIITHQLAKEYLGKPEVLPETYENNDFAGVATGLAWTPVGGDILFIETSLAPGKGEKIGLTGNLGTVMKESAAIALQYLKANAEKLGINPELFGKYDVHIHVPEGAVPKDGPSAGITLASSILSAFTGRKMRERTAMTGEITLMGKVTPVGGIKEKILAARQGGIKRIVLSEENRKDIEDINPEYIDGMEFIYVKTLPEVFKAAILDELAPNRLI